MRKSTPSTGDAMDYQALKERHRAERDALHPNLSLRVHRALSWLNRAEQLDDDPDGRFIFLRIAFNAAYATEIDERLCEPDGKAGAARDRDHDGSPRHALGKCLLSRCDLTVV
jgi:hypothetical protein